MRNKYHAEMKPGIVHKDTVEAQGTQQPAKGEERGSMW